MRGKCEGGPVGTTYNRRLDVAPVSFQRLRKDRLVERARQRDEASEVLKLRNGVVAALARRLSAR
jgi:hypothetical protein